MLNTTTIAILWPQRYMGHHLNSRILYPNPGEQNEVCMHVNRCNKWNITKLIRKINVSSQLGNI